MHHAYFYEGPLALLGELTASAREFFRFEGDNNPDVQVRKFEKFGIDDSHALRGLASFKSTSGRALFVIGIGSVTSEAQQALLKLFEEPQEGTVFVVLAPHGALMATLKSRMMLYEKQLPAQKKVLGSASPQPDYFSDQAAIFLRASGKERSDFIAKLLKDDEDIKERVRDFVNALEVLLAKDIKKNAQALHDIAVVRDYLGDRAPSLKMLLEHLALSLPQV